MAHLVGRFIAGYYAPRRLVWIANIILGIVVGVPHGKHRSLRKEHGFGVAVNRLPVEIPVFNADQPFPFTVRKSRKSFQILTEIVSVRIDTEDIHIDWQRVIVRNKEVFVPGRNIDCAVVFQLQQHRMLGGRLVGEVKADTRLNGFRLAGGTQVHVQHQVIAGIKAPRHVRRFFRQNRAGLPEEEMAIGIKFVG